jgi:hypothetical protein
MKKRLLPAVMGLFVVMLGVVVATSIKAQAARGCFRNVYCQDVWNPVLCPDGQIYSNSCYAYRACQTNCVPAGDR